MLASNPVPTLNQQKADLGIPRDSLKPHPALERSSLPSCDMLELRQPPTNLEKALPRFSFER